MPGPEHPGGSVRRRGGVSPKIAVINESSVMSDTEAKALVQALQTQVSRDFAPLWCVDAKLSFVSRNQHPESGAWQLVLLDDSDQAGALGYHETTAQDLPLGKAFLRTVKEY